MENKTVRGKQGYKETGRKRLPVFFYICLLFILPTLMSGCVTLTDPEVSQEYERDTVGTISGDPGLMTVGQTFIARRARLNGITLWLNPVSPPEGNKDTSPKTVKDLVTIELYHSPEEWEGGGSPLAITHLSNIKSGAVSVSFSPSPDPPGQSYFLILKSMNSTIEVQGRNEDVYPYGEAYINREAVEADLAFTTTYEYTSGSVWEDCKGFLANAWTLIPLAITLLLPGWLLIDFLGLRKRFEGGEQVALSVGLSLAVIPLIMLWTSTLGIHWNRTAVLFVSGLLTAIALWRAWKKPISFRPSGTSLALTGIFILSLGVRIAMIRDLAVPPWVDSVHHGLITRLIMQEGTFPTTYAPYSDLVPTKYHVGYHAALATYLWLSGRTIPEGMLWFGQFLNALTIFSVYLLGKTLTKNNLAGVLAALMTGLFTPMPAYYTSWGRYTQLAGLIILPVAVVFAKRFIDLPSETKGAPQENLGLKDTLRQRGILLLPAMVAMSGLALVHYRAAAFLACLILAIIVSHIPFRSPALKPYLFATLLLLSILGIGSLVLTLPWMWPDLTWLLPTALASSRITQSEFFSGFTGRFLTAALGKDVLALGAFGLVLGLVQRRRFILTLLLWVLALFFLANLGALGLPGGWFVNNNSVEITLFIPISILAGYGLSWIIATCLGFLPGGWLRPFRWVMALAGVFLAGVGAYHLLPILNHTTDLFRLADRPALEWIAQNIPTGQTFLINPFDWGYGLYAGNDGGFWISPLTGQQTVPPPVIYGFSSPEERQKVNTTVREALDKAGDVQALWEYLKLHEIRYIYLGGRGGKFSPKELNSSTLFHTLYSKDGVWIFGIQ